MNLKSQKSSFSAVCGESDKKKRNLLANVLVHTYNSLRDNFILAKLFFWKVRRANDVRMSYSEYGEDLILRSLFSKLGILPRDIYFLEIGTNHPYIGNNSYLLAENGASGVCVEPNKYYSAMIRKYRPRDILVETGAVDEMDGTATYWTYDGKDGWNTFDKTEVDKRIVDGMGGPSGVKTIPVMNVNGIIEKYCKKLPNLLLVDVEGWDLRLLKALDFDKYPFAAICTEAQERCHIELIPQCRNEIQEFLFVKGYLLYADTNANMIFVNKKAIASVPAMEGRTK